MTRICSSGARPSECKLIRVCQRSFRRRQRGSSSQSKAIMIIIIIIIMLKKAYRTVCSARDTRTLRNAACPAASPRFEYYCAPDAHSRVQKDIIIIYSCLLNVCHSSTTIYDVLYAICVNIFTI